MAGSKRLRKDLAVSKYELNPTERKRRFVERKQEKMVTLFKGQDNAMLFERPEETSSPDLTTLNFRDLLTIVDKCEVLKPGVIKKPWHCGSGHNQMRKENLYRLAEFLINRNRSIDISWLQQLDTLLPILEYRSYLISNSEEAYKDNEKVVAAVYSGVIHRNPEFSSASAPNSDDEEESKV